MGLCITENTEDATDSSDGSPSHTDATGRFGLTRRRLLLGAGATAGLAGGGVFYVTSQLEGDFGDYTAPIGFPTVTTRGRVDPESGASAAGVAESEGSWNIEPTDELFVFVHGFSTDDTTARDQAYATRVGLESERPAEVIAYSWDSDLDWGPAKAMADANAAALASWLVEWVDGDGRPVHLLGYSLGGRVVCETVRALDTMGRGDVVASISLLGGAIPRSSVTDSGRYGDAIGSLDGPVSNFYSRSDRVLGWVYRLSDRTRAVGETGISDPAAAPAGYTDVDVSAVVGDHYSYFEPGEGCLPQVVERTP